MSAGAEIVVDGVTKSFEDGAVAALRGVSFRVEPGELVALTGASGSGKSTLLNLIGTLDRPDSGTIAIDAQRLDELEHPAEYRAATIGFVFQAHHLLPTLTASENVQVAMLADEPTGSLDSATSTQVLQLLDGLRRSRGMTILLVTNDEDVATGYADRRLRLRDGVIHAEEPQPAQA